MGENKLGVAIAGMKKGGKLWLVLIMLAAGIILLFLGNSDIFRSASESEEDCVHEEKLNIEDYESALEVDVAKFCLALGAQNVTVSVRLAGSSESIYAQNSQNGTGGGRDEYVIIGTGSSAHPIYLGESSPEILGIGVIITADKPFVRKDEAEALISAAYGVPLNRIYVKIIAPE